MPPDARCLMATTFGRAMTRLVGHIAEDWRWRTRHNYYPQLPSRDVDRSIVSSSRTRWWLPEHIVVMTADHGDLDGAHRLHAGAPRYRRQNNVPLVVVAHLRTEAAKA